MPEWTFGIPEKDGLYWIENEDGEVTIAILRTNSYGEREAFKIGGGIIYIKYAIDYWWWLPIEIPIPRKTKAATKDGFVPCVETSRVV